jgi:hypothetical protein
MTLSVNLKGCCLFSGERVIESAERVLRFCELHGRVMSKPKAGRSGFPEHVRGECATRLGAFFFSPAADISIARPLEAPPRMVVACVGATARHRGRGEGCVFFFSRCF